MSKLHSLIANRSKKIIFFGLIAFFFLCTYIINCLKYIKDIEKMESQCSAELISMKFKLQEYEKRLDEQHVLVQKYQDSEKQKFKDIMESCASMKQQSIICQNQFADLKVECKKIKDNLNDVQKTG